MCEEEIMGGEGSLGEFGTLCDSLMALELSSSAVLRNGTWTLPWVIEERKVCGGFR